ncbi:MAG TPA: hypothetical protein VHO25_22320 [Polyangiaceae bacterium]|nr:hypothetical protein [Polyangiaceae bacterium]
MLNIVSKFVSRKFLVTLLAILAPLISGGQVSDEVVQQVAVLVSGALAAVYVAAQAYVDRGLALASTHLTSQQLDLLKQLGDATRQEFEAFLKQRREGGGS